MSALPDTPDSSAPSSRSVLLNAVVVMACFAIFVGIVWLAYVNTRPANLNPDVSKIDPADQWKYSVEGRAARLKELNDRAVAANSYGMIDEKTGVVRLPIERAMELVVLEHAADRK